MRKFLRKTIFLGVMTALFVMPPLSLSAMPEIFPVGELQEGMSGTAYTVLGQSGEIEPFRVDIIGVVGGGKGSSNLIMAKASGPLIERSGGILQGMSGSPVYIDDKLVGAVAIGIKEMNMDKFFITPIENMLPLWDMPDTKEKIQFKSIDLKKIAEEREKAEQKKKEKETAPAKSENPAGAEPAAKTEAETGAKPEAESAAKPAAESGAETAANGEPAAETKPAAEPAKPVETEKKTLLYVSGFNQAGMSFLNSRLAPFGSMEFYAGSSPMDADGTVVYDASLYPGSPVGVAVMYGDFSIGATGTVTAVEDDRILGFGHEFLHQGNVNYFMTDAAVIGTINGQSAGMRIANIGNIIGRINQDRTAGIAGILGRFPEVVPVRVHVKDNSLAREEDYGVRIAYNEELLPQLSATVAYASLSKVADSLDGSTATVRFQVRTNAVPGGKVERSNMFYNPADVGQVAVLELAQAINLICSNTAEVSDILDVQVDISLDGGRKTASLISAVPDKVNVKPGETVHFKTKIKPYRQPEEELDIAYTVSKTQPEGTLHLDLRGGGLIPMSQMSLLQQAGLIIPTEDGKVPSTEENLRNFMDSGKNNEIVIAPGAVTEVQSEKEQQKAIREAIRASKAAQEHKVNLLGEKKKENPVETKIETSYIIDNVIRASLQVER